MALAMLLAVVAVLFLAAVFTQVGSSAEQKTQTRSLADSAAVAATHNARDNRISTMSRTVPHDWAPPRFAQVASVPLQLDSTACAAAQRNWQPNRHRSPFVCRTGLSVSASGVGARTRVIAPAGEVVSGPVDASGARAEARAHARVVLDRCPTAAGVPGALARWITDATIQSFGASSRCFTSQDESALGVIDEYPWTAPAAMGPPARILTMARNAMRVEIIE